MTRGDVRVHALVDARSTARLEALEHRRGNALHEDAAQELEPGSIARLEADDVDGHPERSEELGEALRSGTGSDRGRRKPAVSVRPRPGRRLRTSTGTRLGELALELRRGRVQIGVDGLGGELAGDAPRRGESEALAALRLRTTSAPRTAPPGPSALGTPSDAPNGIPAADVAAGVGRGQMLSGRRPRRVRARRPASALDDLAEPVHVIRELTRCVSLPDRSFALRSRERERQHLVDPLVLESHHSVAIHHDDIARADVGPRRRDPRRRAPPHAPFVAPRARMYRDQIGRPRATSSSRSRTAPSTRMAATPCAFAWVTRRSPMKGDGGRDDARQHQNVSRLGMGDDSMHHRVVPRRRSERSAQAPRRASRARPGESGRSMMPV